MRRYPPNTLCCTRHASVRLGDRGGKGFGGHSKVIGVTLKRWGQEKGTKNMRLKTMRTMGCGSQAGELAASDTTNRASDVVFVSWPGQAARLSHACPALPAAEPQTRPSASSHTLAHSFPLCSPERGHVHPTPFHRKDGRGAFETSMLEGDSLGPTPRKY